MSLSDHVRTLGRGPGRSRSLTRDEAFDAMIEMLSVNAAPEAVGALLMLVRMKGESPEEIAGFAAAAQASLPRLPRFDLDWPTYAAGRTRGAPWFLLSAMLVAQAGHRVLLHGFNGHQVATRQSLEALGLPMAGTPEEIERALEGGRLVYAPLETLSPSLYRLLCLRYTLGLRSCINTVARMLNPSRAATVVQGVFHPAYRQLQTEAAELLGWQALTVIKGGGGEMERHPAKAVTGQGLRGGKAWATTYPAILEAASRLADMPQTSDPAALWSGEATCPLATEIVVGTAAIALDTAGHAHPEAMARELWASRHTALAA